MDKIKYKYKFPSDYNPKYTNGVYGGITPKGEIWINFFLERAGIPITQTHELETEQVKGKEIKKVGKEIREEIEPRNFDTQLIRFLQAGVIMNYSTAKAVHEWLGKNIKTLEQRGIIDKEIKE